MIRKTVLTVLTLLAIACAAAWIVSYQRYVRYVAAEPAPPSGWRFRSFEAQWGHFKFEFYSFGPEVPRDEVSEDELSKPRWHDVLLPPNRTLRGRLAAHGFSVGYCWRNSYYYEVLDDEGNPTMVAKLYDFRIHVRAWFLFVLFAPYPTIAFVRGPFSRFCRRSNHRYRRERGLCERCAYNLTGNTSGVCPECGTRTATSEDTA